MQIKIITTQIRNDIYGVLRCEHCGHEMQFTGYDDEYWHNNVLPAKICPECDKTTKDIKELSTEDK